MSLTQLGDQTWDFVDATGVRAEVQSNASPAIRLPVKWRLFGPFQKDPSFTASYHAQGITAAPRSGQEVARGGHRNANQHRRRTQLGPRYDA